MSGAVAAGREVTLLDLLDRILDQGVVLSGDVTLSVADVDLIYLGLRAVLTPVERMPDLLAPADDAEPGGPVRE